MKLIRKLYMLAVGGALCLGLTACAPGPARVPDPAIELRVETLRTALRQIRPRAPVMQQLSLIHI